MSIEHVLEVLSGSRPWHIETADVMAGLAMIPSNSVNCVVTSPPYFGLRDYGVVGQMGLEPTPSVYVSRIVAVFEEVKRVLRSDGVCFLNLGDSYASTRPCNRRNVIGSGSLPNGKREARPPRMGDNLKNKDLIGMPWRVAFALQDAGWWLRSDIVWSKNNPMPESVTDRPTRSHEYLFLLTKAARYHYDADAIREDGVSDGKPMKMADGWDTGEGGHGSVHRNGRQKGEYLGAVVNGRNRRSVWTIPTEPYAEAHFATFPTALVEPCVLAGCPSGGVVLDPFAGAGTVSLVATRLGRRSLGIELNPEYTRLAYDRILSDQGTPESLAHESSENVQVRLAL